MKSSFLLALLISGMCAAQEPVSPSPGNAPGTFCSFKQTMVEVKLLSPLGTKTASPGDSFTLAIQSPAELVNGGTVQGSIKKLVAPGRGFGKGKPSMDLEFHTLIYQNYTCPITGELKEVANSKGVAKVDDEGRVVGHTSNKKRVGGALGGAALGALVGAGTGGGVGAAVGAAAGGTAGFLVVSSMTATGSDIQFDSGAIFTLEVSERRQKNPPR